MIDIDENIKRIKENISKTCSKFGRNPEDITVIAVTKTIDHLFLSANLQSFLENGITNFGENRVQEMMEKQPHIADSINWHMIGNLQRNKVKYIVGKVKMIHSLDSVKLASEINRIAEREGVFVDTLIEINIAAEESKHGIPPEQAISLAKEISAFPHIRIRGLMTVAPYVTNPEENRKSFRKMNELYNELKSVLGNDIKYLSMGMTNDYITAIEEGANIVRIGTGIFGSRV